jgi:Ca-activated chloride channel family protein
MAGEKIVQARAALQFCLGKLNPEDRFGLILFNDGIDPFTTALRRVTSTAIDSARRFVDRVEADGGTYIEGALVRSMDLFESAGRPKYLVFLTDGLPTVGTRDPGVIRNSVSTHNKRGARVFTFGVGYDLNAALLNDLASEGKGQSAYVAPKEDVEVAVSNFFRKISRPVLSDPRLQFTGVDVHELYPSDLPDVFAGSEIVVVGRFDEDGAVTARLTGTRGATPVSHVFQAVFTPQSDRYQFIPKLWAGRRIGYLLEDMRKNGETPEVKDEAVRLSKKYGIMTPYTAFLAAPEAVRIASAPSINVPASGTVGVPATSVADILKSQTGVSVRVDRFHIRGGRSEEGLHKVEKSVSEAKLKSMQSTAAPQVPAPTEDDADAAPSISAAGRQFTLINGIWIDWTVLSAPPPKDTIVVKPFSEAYFRLNQVPGMAKLLAIGERVLFLWGSCVVKIDPSGAENWNTSWEYLL